MALRQVQMAASKRFISLSRFLLLLTLIAQLVAGEPLVCSSVVIDASGQLKVVPGWQPGAVAWANLTDQIQENGWAFLQLESNADFNDSLQAYAAGVAEAAVTNKLMYMHWMNTLVGYCGPYKYQTQYCEKLKSYIQENVAWMQEQMESGQDPEYWHQVHLALLQLKGLEDSYDGLVSFPTGNFSLNPVGFLLFQLGGDLEDLESALNKTNPTRVKGSGSCSALIKLLPGNKDLLVSHDTWNTYQSMLRIVKMYSLPFRTTQEESTIIPGSIQSFSSYPGTIFSGDDFYTLSSGLDMPFQSYGEAATQELPS